MIPPGFIPILISATLVAQQAPVQVRTPLLQELAEHRGALVIVGPPGQWPERLADPDLWLLLDGTLVETRPVTDPGCLKIGIAKPGVYLVTPAGKLRASWHGEPPRDLASALRSAGLSSPIDELRSFLAAYPERLDVHWTLVGYLGGQVTRGRTETAFQEFAEAYDALLRKEHWAEGRMLGSYYFGRGLNVPKKAEDHPLINLARTHWQSALEVVRRTPTHDVAWEVLGQLARWHPDHPRLADLLVEIPVAPLKGLWGGEEWPSHSAIETACEQLEQLKDWPGLERFALDRLGRIRGAGDTYHPDLANEWSGVTSYSSTDEISKPTRREREGERFGKWLLVLLNAQLQQGKSIEAQETRRRIDREGNAQSQSRADQLIRNHAQPGSNTEESAK